jgi:hypothetical protein
MTQKPQYSVTLLLGNEVRFLSLSRTARVKPEYRPMGAERYHSRAAVMFAVDHYRETDKILLHGEVKAILLKAKARHERTKQGLYGARFSKKGSGCHDKAQPLVSPSCPRSSVSISTSSAVALKVGPVHFAGHPSTKFQRVFVTGFIQEDDRAVPALGF